ncbi:MAG: O-antigen ligase family protein, partial [Desulfobacula sp.]|uniref:O-antigen ligase family protein n=1 Tax=Desulfobacula sp. TaxID=2593537 RepID=UPI001EC250E0|nr:O-antigen ligase family protein [Desulfobacula sp.]
MGISKKKRQYIKKNYPKLSLEIISADTGASVKEVEKVLGIKVPDQKRNYEIFDLVLEWGILLAVFFAPFILMPGLRDASNIPQDAFVQSSSFLLALVWGLKSISDKKLCFVRSPLILPLSAFVIWCLVSLIVAANLFEGFHVFFQVLSMFIFFLVVLNVYYQKKDFHRLIMALVLSGGIIALIGCCQYLFEFSWIPQARPPAATFTNRNMASQFIVLVIPFGFYLFLKTENYIVGWIATLLTGLMVLYAVYTKSLAAWVSISVEAIVFISILIYLVKTGKYQFKIKSRLYALVLTFTGFLLLINIDSGGFNLKFGGLSDQVTSVQEFVQSKSSSGVDVVRSDAAVKGQSSIEWRWSVWLNSMAMIKDNPLIGVGAGNYKIEYPLYNHKVLKDTKFNLENQLDRAHNDY